MSFAFGAIAAAGVSTVTEPVAGFDARLAAGLE